MTNPVPAATKPRLAAGPVMMREDDAILLVRHPGQAGAPGNPFAGRWTLPLSSVAGSESAEDAVQRVLREQLHVLPGEIEFNDTLYLLGADGSRYVVNAFLCVAWEGEPRFSGRDYADAAWVAPGRALDLEGELADGIAEWLARAFDREAPALTPDALMAELDEARRELLAAFDAIPHRLRVEALEGGWSPLDVLSHVADAEAYYASETRLLQTTAGHTWRPFNDAQWNEAHDLRRRAGSVEAEDRVRARLELARSDTRLWLKFLDPADLEAYGNHAERGAVQIGDRIEKIARHDREHTDQLRTMARVAKVTGATQET
jgi:ADP-ribose pyrophosphatase YjhB (NUDIX family)